MNSAPHLQAALRLSVPWFGLLLCTGAAPAAQESPELTGGFVDVDGARLYYEVGGAGPPVVLIHGGNLDRRMWEDQIASFTASFRVIRYDVRPFGRSGAETEGFSHVDDLERLLDHLEIQDAQIVGLSLGGRIALDFALEHPGRVRRLVLAGPGLTGFEWSRDPAMGGVVAAAEAGEPERAVALWLQHAYMASAMERPALAGRVRRLAEENTHVWSTAPLAGRLPDPPTITRLTEIQIPTLVLLGERDVPDIHAIVARLERDLPDARIIRLPGVGHMLNMEAPAEFNRLALDFLETGEAVSSAGHASAAPTAARELAGRPDPHTELPRIARALLEAVATGDRSVWDRHLADDGVFTDERGMRRTKAELLDILQPLPEGYAGRLEPREVEVRDFGATAVITFRAEERVTLYGQTVADTYFETDTYLLRDGRWQMVASHVQAQVADPPASEVTEAVLDRYAGVYELAPDVRLTLRGDDGHLIMEREGRPPQHLLPETEHLFFTPGGWDARWIFIPDADGRVTRILARRRGEDLIWTRVN